MAFSLVLVEAEDAKEVADFRYEAFGGDLAAIARDVVRRMREGKVFVARRRGRVIATLCLTRKKPWAIDASHFTRVAVPLYLLGMAVTPPLQRKGIGRHCLNEAERIAAAWPAQAIRLDAFDGPTGAGAFYQRCGYTEVGRAVYRQTPLIYYEHLIAGATAT